MKRRILLNICEVMCVCVCVVEMYARFNCPNLWLGCSLCDHSGWKFLYKPHSRSVCCQVSSWSIGNYIGALIASILKLSSSCPIHFALDLLLQDNLLLYNHAKLMAEDNHSSGKEYLVSIMFSHYDQNNNGALEREELEQVCFQTAVWLPVFMFHLQKTTKWI